MSIVKIIGARHLNETYNQEMLDRVRNGTRYGAHIKLYYIYICEASWFGARTNQNINIATLI